MHSFKLISGALILTLLMFECDNPDTDDPGSVGTEVHTLDLNTAPQLFSFESASFSNSTYDLSFESGEMTYLVALNSTAGVMAFGTDSLSFDTNEMPAQGFAFDSTQMIIGDGWMDMNTYNPTDHSITSGSMIYFIRTSDYQWAKFRVISGSPSVFNIEYALYSEDTGYAASQTAVINYSADTPALFDFTAAAVVDPVVWDLGFASTPEYSTELQTNFYMPTFFLNSTVMMAFVDDQTFADISALPANPAWISDTNAEHTFGNGGSNQILVYHPEPPYNHQVIVEHPERVYFVKTATATYKLQFTDYSSGIVVFKYDTF